MSVKIALAGNPNCGKTTMFNDLTGSNQYVGNWPGVTVEKKEGRLKGHQGRHHPGPARHLFAVALHAGGGRRARNYLVGEKPDAIINIVDGTNIERNLYLTTQLIELGIPMVVAVNMIDVVRKNGDSHRPCEASAQRWAARSWRPRRLEGRGFSMEAAAARGAARPRRAESLRRPSVFDGQRGARHRPHRGSHRGHGGCRRFLRWYAIKLFERDEKVHAGAAPRRGPRIDTSGGAHRQTAKRSSTTTRRASSQTSATPTSARVVATLP